MIFGIGLNQEGGSGNLERFVGEDIWHRTLTEKLRSTSSSMGQVSFCKEAQMARESTGIPRDPCFQEREVS